MKQRWRELLEIFTGLLAELTDQAAYQRHLAAHGAVHSPQAWRTFQDQQWQARARRPKCC